MTQPTNLQFSFENIGKNIYKIITARGSGSSIYLSDKNILVTNYHVIQGFHTICIENQSKQKILGHVILINTENDLAFIKPETPLPNNTPIQLASQNTIQSQDEVFVLGYPFGLPFTITKGIISSPEQIFQGKILIQTDAAVNPGNSGGAMINQHGQLVGVTVSKFIGDNTDNIGFGIPIQALISDLESLDKKTNDGFCIKCPQCGFFLYEQKKFCPSCGGQFENNLFDKLPMSPMESLIEEVIASSGINPIITRNGENYWEFRLENKSISIEIQKNCILFSVCISKIPEKNLSDFYTYCLSPELGVYHATILKNNLFMTYLVHISDMHNSHKEEYVQNMKGFFPKMISFHKFLQENFDAQESERNKI